MLTTHSSSTLIVVSDTPIGDCIRKMRDQNVGSILVVSYTFPYDLIGIFTERDLLKWIAELQTGRHWDKAIGTLMKKPVMTISLFDMDQAPERMLTHQVRHLPVVYEDDTQKQRVVGVVSMRALYRMVLKDKEKKRKRLQSKNQKGSRVEIGVLAKEPYLRKSIHAILRQHRYASMSDLEIEDIINSENLLPRVRGLDFLIFDIDHYGPTQWAKVLNKFNLKNKAPKTLILFNSLLHEKRNIHLIRGLTKTRKYATFSKPLNVFDILFKILRWST